MEQKPSYKCCSLATTILDAHHTMLVASYAGRATKHLHTYEVAESICSTLNHYKQFSNVFQLLKLWPWLPLAFHSVTNQMTATPRGNC